jgi:meiotically up-regulated gene 157 (Mug157) protein
MLILPQSINIPRKTRPAKKVNLGHNTMHHTDRFTYNLAKIEFSKIVEDQKDLLPSLSLPLQLTYTYYTGTKRLADLSNHCVFVDKFFSDALVQLGYIPDDSYMYIRQVIYKYG